MDSEVISVSFVVSLQEELQEERTSLPSVSSALHLLLFCFVTAAPIVIKATSPQQIQHATITFFLFLVSIKNFSFRIYMTKARENLPFLRKSDVKNDIKNRFPKWETVSYCFRTFCYIYYNRLCLKNQCRLFFTIFFTCQCQLFFIFRNYFTQPSHPV